MDVPAHIGASITLKGDITASEPLTIAGQVEGSITVNGHTLTIAAGSHIAATVAAETIVVAGHVTGKLTASTRIVLRRDRIGRRRDRGSLGQHGRRRDRSRPHRNEQEAGARTRVVVHPLS